MKKILLASLLMAVSFFCFAEKRTLSVDDAVALALENNISVKQSKMDLDLLETKNKYSWNSISPSLSLSGGLSGSQSGLASSFSESDPTLSWNASGSVRFTFATSLYTTIKAARLAYEQGEMSYEQTKRSIELSVRKTFYSLLYFNENLELQQRSLETAKQTYEANLSKYNQGRLSELNLLASQYNYESKVPTVENLKTSYEADLDNFKVILGVNLTDEIELTGSLEDALNVELYDELLSSDLDEIPAVKSALKSIEISENALAATRFSAYGPSLSLSANAATGAGINPASDQTLSVSYSATVSIPLDGYLPWSTGSLSVKSQKEALEKQKQTLESTKTSAAISIRNSVNTIQQALTQLELYEKNVELMQKTYDMTRNSYNVGSVDLLSLQTAENNLYQARYNVENQRYTIISAVLDLENTLGLEFGSLNKSDNTNNDNNNME